MKNAIITAQNIASNLNTFSFKYKDFCSEMSKQHKTLQQSFTRLCIEWLKHCADDSYQVDGRNEATKKVALDLYHAYNDMCEGNSNEKFEDITLPMI